MPSLVTKGIKRARKYCCKGRRKRLSADKRVSRRVNRHRVNQEVRGTKYAPDTVIEPLRRTEMFTAWEVI